MGQNLLNLNFDLHPKQLEALESPATELLYGGAAGPGKSHLARVAAIAWALAIPGLQIFFFRRLYDDLIKNHVEGPTGFRSMLAALINARDRRSSLTAGRLCEVVEGEIRFWNGSKIFLCHCQHEKDLIKYQGPEFHVLFLEEATQFTEYQIRFLRSRLRIPDTLKIPKQYEGLFPRAVYTANPGGVGHRYVKEAFIRGRAPGEIFTAPLEEGGMVRQFIRARLEDNPSIDPVEYDKKLAGLPPAIRKALREGDWDAIVGAYFPELSRIKHGISPFVIPAHWPRYSSLDWGACGEGDPFSLGWWTVADGSLGPYPRGSLIRYREWYGRGLPKTTVRDVSKGINERERDEVIAMRVAGRDLFDHRNGPSLAEEFRQYGLVYKPADTARIPGWQQMRERMQGVDDIPLFYIFDTCIDYFETVTSLQHDSHDPNDCAQGEDHQADESRYMCMARPWAQAREEPADRPIPQGFSGLTYSQLLDKHFQARRTRR